jgi:transcription elongation factor GreB
VSKAFTKEDSADDPLIVPERAPLPAGVPNYVTERGRRLLEAERERLLAERADLRAEEGGDAEERKKQLGVLSRRLQDLTERLATAKVVTPAAGSERTVRFGATVTLRTVQGPAAGQLRRIKLVGVDEAAGSPALVAFYAPIARAILGHQAGEQVTRRSQSGEEVLEIVEVEYEKT